MSEINTMPTKTEGETCWCDRDWHQPIRYEWNVKNGYDCPLCLSVAKVDDLNRELENAENARWDD